MTIVIVLEGHGYCMSKGACGKADSPTENSDKDPSVCPTCGRDDFKNKRGMKMHHASIHGESLRLVDVTCDNCGVVFEKEPHHVENTERNFCREECQGEYLSEKITKVCDWCGEEYETWPYNEKRSRFCRPQCQNEWMSENLVGENHACFKGYEHASGAWWRKRRKEVFDLRGRVCHYCGVGEDDLDRGLHIHHTIPRKKFDDKKRADRIENLIPLCQSCHPKWEGLCIRPQFIKSETS